MNNIYGFDIEAVPLQLYSPEAKLLCASVAQGDLSISYVRDHYQVDSVSENINLTSLAIIGTILKEKTNIITGHNISFDIIGWERFYRYQYWAQDTRTYTRTPPRAIQASLFDTMIAHYLVGYKDSDRNNLNYVANKYLGVTKLDIKPKEIPNTPIDILLAYNIIDSILVYRLYEPLMNEIVDNGFETLYKYLMKVLKILISMSIRGVRLDLDYIKKHKEEVEEKLDIYDTLNVFAFGDINVNSPKQLQEVLYDKFKLPILDYTPTGNPSTGVDTLVKLKNHSDIHELQRNDIQRLLEYRKLKKLHSTYLKALEGKHLGFDDRIHTHYFLGKGFDQGINFGTESGRTSSSNPNLQNQPNKVTIDDLIVDVRRAFIPTDKFNMFKSDYSQLEMRVAASLSKDKVMLQTFKDGLDIHIILLQYVYEEDYDWLYNKIKVEEDHKWYHRRRVMKNFNFAGAYGASPWKLQMMLLKEQQIDMSIDEVRDITRKVNKTYSGLTRWRYMVYDLIYETGKVVTETGRIRYFFEPGEAKHYDRKTISQFNREGLNDIIQSFASDIAIFGLYFTHQYLRKNKIGHPLLFVHDSNDGEYKVGVDETKLEAGIRKCMIDKPKRLLGKEFNIDTTNLHLDVDINTNLQHWS